MSRPARPAPSRRPTRGLLAAATLAAALAGCGVSREAARDRVAEVACQRYEACNRIGSGKEFASFSECVIEQRAFWNDVLPAGRCDGNVNGEQFDACISAVRAVRCENSGFDQINVLSRCNADAVCIGD
jgi:hypothetical protein